VGRGRRGCDATRGLVAILLATRTIYFKTALLVVAEFSTAAGRPTTVDIV
jgi:hypothetical protein